MHKVFSIPGCLVMVVLLCTLLSVHFQMDAVNTVLLSSVGLFCYGKLALAISFTQGYGVKQGVTKILGMPILLFVGFSLISVLIFGLHYTVNQIDQNAHILPTTITKLRSLSWSATIGLVVALAHWYFYARKELFHQSEYNVRCESLLRKESEEETEAIVAKCRELGIIRS